MDGSGLNYIMVFFLIFVLMAIVKGRIIIIIIDKINIRRWGKCICSRFYWIKVVKVKFYNKFMVKVIIMLLRGMGNFVGVGVS